MKILRLTKYEFNAFFKKAMSNYQNIIVPGGSNAKTLKNIINSSKNKFFLTDERNNKFEQLNLNDYDNKYVYKLNKKTSLPYNKLYICFLGLGLDFHYASIFSNYDNNKILIKKSLYRTFRFYKKFQRITLSQGFIFRSFKIFILMNKKKNIIFNKIINKDYSDKNFLKMLKICNEKITLILIK